MATTGVMNGTKLRLYVDQAAGTTYTALGTSLDVTLNLTHSPRETTNQDSAGFATFLEGKRVSTIDFNNLHAEDSANNFEDWYGTWDDSTKRAKVTFKVATATSGDMGYTGTGYITSLTLASGGPENNATFNGSIQVTGPIVDAATAP